LKIAIVTNNYKPYSGGVVSSIDSFSRALRTLGNTVNIITLDFTNDAHDDENVFRIKCPIKFTYKNNPIAVPLLPYKKIFSQIKKLSPDIIHSQHPFLLGNNALKVSNKLKIPIVFTYHTVYEEYLDYIPLPKIFTKPIVRSMVLSYCNRSDGIIVPSESIYNYLNQSSVKQSMQIIPSGILPVFEMNPFTQKEARGPFKLLTVSRFVKEKNIYFLLDVFSKLNQDDFTFTLIGYGSELGNLKNYAYQKLNLSEQNLKFIEKPDKEVIASFYRDSDVFIFSSTTETQGLVLAEAMSCGTPVVALKASGSNDIIKNGTNGFLVESKHEMIKRINQISKDPILHRQMQKQSWLTGQSYNSFNSTQKLINFYKTIISDFNSKCS